MAKKKYIVRGRKLKAPMYSPVFGEAEKIKREPPGKPPPEAEYREYDLNRLDKGGTKTGGIWELGLFPFEALAIIADELRKRARLEKPGLEVELRDLRVLLETGLITEEEYGSREKEIRAKYETEAPARSEPKLSLRAKRSNLKRRATKK